PGVAHDDRAGADMLGVVGDGGDVRVADRHPGAAVALGVGHRAAAAQVLDDRVGVGDPLGAVVVEVGGVVGDRAHGLAHASSSMTTACSGQLRAARRAASSWPGVTTPSPTTTPSPMSSGWNSSGARL